MREVGVGVEREKGEGAAEVAVEKTKMAATVTVDEKVGAEGVEEEEVVEEAELAVKARQEVREVLGGGAVEGGEGEEVRLTCRRGPVQKQKTAQEMPPHLP